ncbi:MAG: glycosyltransferase [Lachnospiraceae bacterium]|nr:glycosyltransferase [Lachnospiraceae bacterium]
MVRETGFEIKGHILYRHEAVSFEKGDIDQLLALEDVSINQLATHSITNIAAVAVSCDCPKYIGDFDGYKALWRYAALREANALNDKQHIKVLFLDCPLESVSEQGLNAGAFILGNYSNVLQQLNLFDPFFLMLMNEAANAGKQELFLSLAKEAIAQRDSVKTEETGPVITLLGEGQCGSVLDSFATSMAQALRENDESAIAIDMGDQNPGQEMSKKREFKWLLLSSVNPKAVIGFQTSYFTEKLSNGVMVGNLFKSKKFQFVFDHPLYVCYNLMQPIKDLYALTLDEDYAKYINDYLDNTKKAYFFPPAGEEGTLVRTGAPVEKIYDLTFIGKYFDYRSKLENIKSYPEDRRKRANALYDYMMKHPNTPIEEAFKEILRETEGVTPDSFSHDEYVAMLHVIRDVGTAVKFYYREQVIKTILDAGIELHVFDDYWKHSPFAGYLNLIVHNEVEYVDSMDIMAQSKISLNVMSWHKAGMTERVANAMLNKSVCLTDKTRYLEKEFKDGEDIVFYDLENLEALPDKIRTILSDEKWQERMEEAAYKKALEYHTWNARIRELKRLF